MRDPEGVEGIAIIGMSGRFPKASNLEEFWRNLRDGVEAITTFAREELAATGIPEAALDHPQYVYASGAIEGFEDFDADFFDFSAREAQILDPNYRLFLEHAWMALEKAGYDPFTYDGAIGIYGGMMAPQYLMSNLLTNAELTQTVGSLQLRIFNDKDFLASLTAYKLNLQGPSMSVQTACATSLVTTSLACQSLLSYQCDIALSGGVSVAVPGKSGYLAHPGVFSSDGHCRAFDARAGGTVSGRGAGVVVLKRLDRALEDGDHIHAVIRGWAVNNDGALKVGYTAPSVDGQTEVIAMAQAMAGVEAESITYVETHGTATPMGDQIEVAALTEVFRETTDKQGFCALGSVKTNIGHLDAAAGVASLIKTTLALEHGFLPPSLHFEQANPAIAFDGSPFFVQSRPAAWERDGGPRRAGVSAFAVGGVNAHLVLEEAPEIEPSGAGRPQQVLILSAKTETALDRAAEQLTGYLSSASSARLEDVAYTLQVGRRAFEHRRAVICSSTADAVEALTGGASRRLLSGKATAPERPAVFLFPGLGSHYVGMGRELYKEEAVFRDHLDHCAEALEPHLELDIRTLLYPEEEPDVRSGGELARMLGRGGGSAAGELLRTRVAQPAVFAVEYALARLFMAWGVEPEAMIGYSLGEYVAACLAGVFRLEDALALVAERARQIDGLPAGAMLAVPLAEGATRELLTGEPLTGEPRPGQLSITAVNGPQITVVGGREAAIADLERRLEQRGEVCRRLETSHAFHSHMMEPILDAYRACVAEVELRPPEIPFLSNVTGNWIRPEEATDPGYWAEHLRRPVRFVDQIEEVWRQGERVLLEVGPGQALSSWALQHPAAGKAQRAALAAMPHAFDPQSDQTLALTAFARLWLLGVEVDWVGFSEGERRHRVPLPTYPFERRRYWLDRAPGEDAEKRASAVPKPAAEGAKEEAKPLAKAEDLGDWFYLPLFKPQARWPSASGPHHPAEEGHAWLFFVDGEGIGDGLAERLEDEGHTVVLVAAGERFEKIEEGAYTLDPGAPEGYIELLADLDARGLRLRHAVHLWTLGTEPTAREALDLGLYSLTFLAQAWGTRRIRPESESGTELEILVISSHLHQVTGTDEIHPEKAAVLGPCAVLPKEFPGIDCRSVEISLPAASPAEERILDQLYRELGEDPAGPPVAYRGAHRFVRQFEPAPLPERSAAGGGQLRERGVYLITGGLGGIGLTLAEELARAVRARLVLLGRSSFPDVPEWPRWLAEHPPSDPTSRRIRQLERCRECGAEILMLAADVADPEAVRRARQRTLERFGAVHGILHAAGVVPGGLVEIKTREELDAVLAPKVRGTRVLHEVFSGDDLDFLLLCSSLTSLAGGFGMLDHTAANVFLDAFAQAAAPAGRPWVVAVNWDAWLEVGQAAAAAAKYGLAPEDGGEVLRRPEHPLLDACVFDSGERIVYRSRLDPARHWVLDEHRYQSFGVMPGTGYLEMVRAAWEDHRGDGGVELRQVVFLAPMAIPDGEQREVRIVFERRDPGYDFTFESGLAGAFTRHVEGRALPAAPGSPAPLDLAGLAEAVLAEGSRTSSEDTRTEVPAADEEGRFQFGSRWRSLEREVLWGEGRGLISLKLDPEFSGELETFRLHPAMLDVATAFIQHREEGTYLPIGYDRLVLRRPLPPVVHSHARLSERDVAGAQAIAADIVLYGDDGLPVAEIEGFTLRRIDPATVAASADREAAPGLVGIRPSEGAAAFRRLLALPELPAQVLISTRDFPALLRMSDEMAPESHAQSRIDHLHGRSGKAHPRPELATRFVAPQNELEEDLAALWRDLLALSEVGIHDNFFDLGGDSLLATRLIALIAERFGVRLPLRAIFGAPSLAELAVALAAARAEGNGAEPVEKTRPRPIFEQPLESGPVPLTPNQLSFFESYPETPDYWNVTFLFEVHGRLHKGAFETSLQYLLSYHDALRLRFFSNGEGWRQEITAPSVEIPFYTADLTALPAERKRGALEKAGERLQRSLHISQGPLLRLILFELGAGEPDRLLFIGHHIAMDYVSFQIFVEDLQTVYRQVERGEAALFPSKTSSFKAWSERLLRHAHTPEIREELDYWLSLPWRKVEDLPLDHPGGENNARSSCGVQRELSQQDSELVSNRLPRIYGVTVEEVLVTVLARTLARWTGRSSQLISLTHHWRSPFFSELDISRTVGYFSSPYPVLLDLGEDPDPAAVLRSVSEQLRRLPQKGLGFQTLRHLSPDSHRVRKLRALPQPDVTFNYSAFQAAQPQRDAMFRKAQEFPGEFVDLSVKRPSMFYIYATQHAHGRLELAWNYSDNCHDRRTIEELTELFEESLRELTRPVASSPDGCAGRPGSARSLPQGPPPGRRSR